MINKSALFFCLLVLSFTTFCENLHNATIQEQKLASLINNQYAQMALCGKMNFKRKQRNCLEQGDLKRCLELNNTNPLFEVSKKENYNCVNSTYSQGTHIIGHELSKSDQNMCLAKNVEFFFEEILATKEFQQFSLKYEQTLGAPLLIYFGANLDDEKFNLELDTTHLKLQQDRQVSIALKVLKPNSSECQIINREKLISSLSSELVRLSLIKTSRLKDDPHSHKSEIRVFDSARFRAKKLEKINLNQRSISSKVAN